jgi:uncharacterized membrane protein YfcA
VPIGLLAAALVMGMSLGTLGAGGSILAVPALVYLGGLSPRDATVASLVVVGAAALAGALRHARIGNVTASALPMLLAGILVGTLAGAAANQRVDDAALLALLALAMLAAAWRMARDHSSDAPPPARASQLVLLAAGALLGVVTGLLGIGGGFLAVPVLVTLAAIPMRAAIGTSLVLIAVSAGSALAAQLAMGARLTSDAWLMSAIVAAVGVMGVIAGAHVSALLPARALQRAFAALLVPVACFMIVDAITGV